MSISARVTETNYAIIHRKISPQLSCIHCSFESLHYIHSTRVCVCVYVLMSKNVETLSHKHTHHTVRWCNLCVMWARRTSLRKTIKTHTHGDFELRWMLYCISAVKMEHTHEIHM